jgi:hypothetical protein
LDCKKIKQLRKLFVFTKNNNVFVLYIMVLMNGSRMARNTASIVNRPNCGGPKKAGLAPSVGLFISSNPNLIGAVNTVHQLICMGNFSNPSQTPLRHSRIY